MSNIIIRGKTKYANSMSELETNLRKDGKSCMSEGELQRAKHIERKVKEKYGMNGCHLTKDQLNSFE